MSELPAAVAARREVGLRVNDSLPFDSEGTTPADPTTTEMLQSPDEYGVAASVLDPADADFVRTEISPDGANTQAMMRAAGTYSGSGVVKSGGGCSHRPVQWKYMQTERFMSIYNWDGAPITVEQTKSTTHNIGAVFNYEGAGWKVASGTVGIGTSGTTENGARSRRQVNRTFYNKVDLRKWKSTCQSGRQQWTTYTWKPARMAMFFTDSRKSAYQKWDHHCHPIKATGHIEVWKTQGKSYAKSGGVSIMGGGVSAQSGFNTGTKTMLHIDRTTPVCTNKKGVTYLEARAYKAWHPRRYREYMAKKK